MELFIEIEIVGCRLLIYGDSKEILTIKVYQNNEEKYNYHMRKVGFYEVLKILREKLRVGLKVKETMVGLSSEDEILVDGLQLEEKIKDEVIVAVEGIRYVNVKQKEVRGMQHNQVIRLFAINCGKWRIGMDVHTRGGEKVEVQQNLLVDLYANAKKIMETIDAHYREKQQQEMQQRMKRKRKTSKARRDEMIILWSGLLKEKIREKSMEYCLGCKGEEVKHRDDCYHGNNVKFILHHFPIIVADVMCIHNFWREIEPPENPNPYEDELLKSLQDSVKNRSDNKQFICRKILHNILA